MLTAKLYHENKHARTKASREMLSMGHRLKIGNSSMIGWCIFHKKARIANAVDKMQELLNDLLELSRMGRIIIPPRDTPFDGIVKESIELSSGLMEAGKVKVEIQKELPIIHGDKTRLVEVMQNLISNAIKFIADQTTPCTEIGTTYSNREWKNMGGIGTR